MSTRTRSQQPLKTSLAVLLAGGVFFFLWSVGALDGAENRARDIYVDAISTEVASNFLIVEIDSASVEAVGRWPWPRRLFSTAIEQLAEADIASLMIDVDFSASSNRQNDDALAESLASLSKELNIHLPAFIQHRSHADNELMLRRPLPSLAENAELVSVNMQPASDGLVRFLTAGFRWQDRFYPSAWNAIAQNTDRSTWIDFSISPHSFQYVSFSDLITGQVSKQLLQGRDVFIGATAIELGDTLAVPIHRALPGVVIQALGAETLRRGGLFKIRTSIFLVLLGLFWIVSAMVLTRLSWVRGLQTLVGIAFVLPALAIVLYQQASLIVDIIAPLTVSVLVYAAVNLARLDSVTLERLWLQIRLRDNQVLHDRIVSTANDCIICVDRNGTITRANPAMQALCNCPEDTLVGTPLIARLPDLEQALEVLPNKPFDTYLLDTSDDRVPVEATISTVDLSSEPIYTIVLRDLRERVAREKELQFQATHDLLTGLLNRPAFFCQVNQDLENHPVGCILSLDLDYFHEVNNTYGHDAGDRLLRTVASRIESQITGIGHAARVGGDGFALWLPSLRFSGDGQQFCEHLIGVLEDPIFLDDARDVELQISGTVGAVEIDKTYSPEGLFTPEGDQPNAGENNGQIAEALLRKSADAMRLAKSDGVAIRCYSAADHRAATRRLELVPAIRSTIRDDAFNLVYQPKLRLDTLHPIGCEALLRWPHGRGEIVPVDILIEVAENSRQIAPLTSWVVDTLLQQEAYWKTKSMPRQMAVNISARLFQDHNFIAGLKDLLSSSSGYYQFEFEITETALMGNKDRAIQLVAELLDSGGTLAIDDYGTGYSSLGYLQDLNASVLKIDKSFVTNIEQNKGGQVIVQSTIKMAHELGMKVVAEGVETELDERFLKGVSCDYVQGYHYAKPLPVKDLERWLTEWQSDEQPLRSSILQV